MAQQAALLNGGHDEVINLYGANTPNTQQAPQALNLFGEAASGPRQNIGVTAWGAMADNPWGTFADNAWGTTSDNVWGTASTNVWGGIGGNAFGGKGIQFFGTGNGTNYLKSLTSIIKAYFGFSSKSGKDAFKAVVKARQAGGGSSGRNATARAAVGRTGR